MRALFLSFLLFGCDGVAPSPDAGPPEIDAGRFDPALEVGIGERSFASFEEGDTLLLVCGGQGLQHVWIALRAWGIDPRGTIHDLSLRRDIDGEVVSQTFHVRVSMQPVEGQPYFELYGLTLVVPEPDRAIGEDLTLRVTTEPTDGSLLEVERDIDVQWETPEGCIPQG